MMLLSAKPGIKSAACLHQRWTVLPFGDLAGLDRKDKTDAIMAAPPFAAPDRTDLDERGTRSGATHGHEVKLAEVRSV
jgi:hypothetical protein